MDKHSRNIHVPKRASLEPRLAQQDVPEFRGVEGALYVCRLLPARCEHGVSEVEVAETAALERATEGTERMAMRIGVVSADDVFVLDEDIFGGVDSHGAFSARTDHVPRCRQIPSFPDT